MYILTVYIYIDIDDIRSVSRTSNPIGSLIKVRSPPSIDCFLLTLFVHVNIVLSTCKYDIDIHSRYLIFYILYEFPLGLTTRPQN